MFLDLAHTKLNAYQQTRIFTLECYKVTKLLPADERFAMVQQLRRAALSTHLNLAEGASRKSSLERKRYFEIARGSVIEVDAAIGIAFDLGYVTREDLENLGKAIVTTFKLLTGLINHAGDTYP
ncbi:MAG TPA: four helix bundle protein [Segetibacter sp.]